MIASQRTSTDTLTRKFPRNASSRESVYRPRLPMSRRYLASEFQTGTASTSEGAIASQAQPVEKPRQHHEKQGPAQLGRQVKNERHPLDFSQEDDRGKVRHVLKGKDLEQPGPRLGKQIERQHVPRDEKIQSHDDIEQRRHLEKPEAHHSHARLKEEADQKRKHERNSK